MRKYIILLALCAATFQGCDFVRTLAGRPTAAKVEEIRQEQMRLEEARKNVNPEIFFLLCIFILMLQKLGNGQPITQIQSIFKYSCVG